MTRHINKVQLFGNLGGDPEIHSFQNGGKVANFSVATSESWKELKEKTQWRHVAVFDPGLLGIVEKYLKKGSKVLLEGQLETRKWQDKDGADRTTTEIALRPYRSNLILLHAKDADAALDTDPAPPTRPVTRIPIDPAPNRMLKKDLPFGALA